MKSEWKECTLSDLGDVVGGATPSTKESANYENGEIAWITPKDLASFSGRFIARGERNITEQGLKSCSAQLMPQHSVLFSSRAPIGYVAIADRELCTNQGFKSIVPNANVDYLFLYYLLTFHKDAIENLGSGTTFKEVSAKVMRGVKVKVPSLNTQRKIAAVLSSLDNKIETSNAICRNLEEQADALFKAWFVDFVNKGGVCPHSWTEKKLSECTIKITDGVHNSVADVEHSDYLLLSCKNIVGGVLRITSNERRIDKETFDRLRRRTRLAAGDILLSSVGTIGEMVLLADDPDSFEFQRSVAIIKADRTIITPDYLFCALKNRRAQIKNAAHGAVQQCLFLSDIADFSILTPSPEAMAAFSKVAENIHRHIAYLQNENRCLAALRDTLLPRLMSGELDVSAVKL